MSGPVVNIVSGFVNAYGVMSEAGAEAGAANFNARAAKRNEAVTRDQTRVAIEDKNVENRRQLSQLRSAYGANGFMFDGSALDVLESSAIEGAYDVAKIKYGGKIKAAAYRDERKLAKMQSRAATTAGYVGGATAILGGFEKAFANSPGAQDAANQAGQALLMGG